MKGRNLKKCMCLLVVIAIVGYLLIQRPGGESYEYEEKEKNPDKTLTGFMDEVIPDALKKVPKKGEKAK